MNVLAAHKEQARGAVRHTRAAMLAEALPEAVIAEGCLPSQHLDDVSLSRRHDRQPQRGAVVAAIADGRVAELFEALDAVDAPVFDRRLSMGARTSKSVSRRCARSCRNAIASGGRRAVGPNKWGWHEVLYAGAALPSRCVHACPVRACPAPAGSAVEHERVAMAICCREGIRRDGHAPARRLHRLGLASLGGPAYRAAR